MTARRLLTTAFGLAALAFMSYGAYAWYRSFRQVSTDDAYIDGAIATVSAKVSGQVIDLVVRDNQSVKQGEVLARIDPRDYAVKVEHARAAVAIAQSQYRAASERIALGKARAQGQMTQAHASALSAESSQHSAREMLESSRAGVAARLAALMSVRSELDRARALAERASSDFNRAKELFERELIPRQDLDHAATEWAAAAAFVSAAEQRVTQAERDLTGSEADAKFREAGAEPNQIGVRMADARVIDARARRMEADAMTQEVRVREAERDLAAAQLREAQANLALAELNLDYAQIRAPVTGMVSKKSVELGQVVEVGQPLLAVVPLHDVWVTANFKETQLARVRPGMKVRVRVDSFPGKVFNGTVDSIAAGTGARFSLLPPENATGNWVKVVQRVPVKITLDPKEYGNPHTLRTGMSVFVTILLK
ncbi:MAG: HlyD family secretion protein [Candidatus Rokuibacteriota bacterium]|nr:MAG: HlyD family secretion protein [Candidatus Rokubacteria bacterium]